MTGWLDQVRGRLRAAARGRAVWHRTVWHWARLAVAGVILAVLIARVGSGPFVAGVRRVSPGALAAALAITAVTTLASAWRWRLIARGLGLDLPLPAAVAAYYRSQFLNSTLPGGVVGDLHRAVRQGEQTGQRSRALRSVGWDRAAGQVVQVGLAAVVLLALDSPLRPALRSVAAGAAAVLAVAALAVGLLATWAGRTRRASWPARVREVVRSDVRDALATRSAALPIALVSAAVVAGHVGVFLVAARADGTAASVAQLVPIAMLVLLAMTVPTSIGGWGPREGVAAWAFATAGLGAAQGVETATVYGVLSLVATLPGALVLLLPAPAAATVAEPAPREAVLTHG